MAEAEVFIVIGRIGDLLISEAKFLFGVRHTFERLRAELERMRSLLEDAGARMRDGDELVHLKIVEVREAAYALEDVIETYVLRIYSRRKRGLKNVLKRPAWILKAPKEIHKFTSENERISNIISALFSDLKTYGIREISVSSLTQLRRELRRTYSGIVEYDVVGLDKDIKELVAHLTEKGNPRRVIAICGMGGLGKTTLARKVYRDPQVWSHFDCFAWAFVSQQCDIRDVWEIILINLTSPTLEERKEISRMRDDEIAKELYSVLKDRKCLVILDDIWATSTWDGLKAAFPEDATDTKIILTTRSKQVALHADRNVLICELRSLNKEESWELFVANSSFGKYATGNYERMEELGREMLRHCAGLPLAIVVLSGLLSTKRTVDEWEMLAKEVESNISRGKGRTQQGFSIVLWVLSLSYNELPYYLKPCFLYLASYPENSKIEVKPFCQKLIAEGFVLSDHQSPTETIEDVAYKFLRELADMHMIQVEKLGSTGRMKTFSVDVLMWDFCLKKAQEENFLQFFDLRDRYKAVETLSSVNVVPENNVRRVAMYANGHIDDLLPLIGNGDGSLRSLAFVNQRVEPREQGLKPLFYRFQKLRLLNLENMVTRTPRFSGKLPKEIGKLIHLRFLSLSNSYVEEIPSSIGNLRFLQTLNLWARTKRLEVPNVIWRLTRLRHLYLPSRITLVRGKYLRLPNLGNLQTLVNVPTKYLDVNEFRQMTNLKKLGLCLNEDWEKIYPSSTDVKFDCLQSLTVYSMEEVVINIIPVISCYPQIYKLKVRVPIIKLPEADQFSPNLMKLELYDTRLKNDSMRTIEKLPKLRVLSIWHNSFVGNEMVCSKDGFPVLESLCFHSLRLKGWRIEEGALPRLLHLRLFDCRNWRSLPDGLKDVTTLREVEIDSMPWEFKKRLKEGGEDFYKVQHVPSLVFINITKY